MKDEESMKKYYRYLLAPVVVGLLIFTATCLIQSDDIPNLPPIFPWDKAVHFGMFFVLSFVNFIDYFKLFDRRPDKRKWLFWGLILPVLYGGIIEILQEYFFSRSGDWIDFAADVLGSLTATAVVFYINNKYWKKGKKTIFA